MHTIPVARTRPSAVLLLIVLLAAAPHGTHSQELQTVLTKAKDVLALPAEAAEAGKTSVRLRGIVTDVSAKRDELSLHDGAASLSVMLVGGALSPELGTEVEIEGRAYSETFMERKRTRVESGKITVLGPGTLPQPSPAGVKDASEFKRLDQWVSVEGTVLQVRISMSLFTIQLATEDATCNVLVRDWPRDGLPRDWVGGRVRVTGNNRGYLPNSGFLSVVVPSPAQVTVLKTGVVDPFDAPAATIGDLRKAGTPKAERFKLTGTLLDSTPGNVFYARAEDGSAFSFYMLLPIDEDKSGRFSTPVIMPTCNPGDVLEVVGMPAYLDPGVHLNYAQVRVVRSGPVPAAVNTDIAKVSSGGFVHDLVELHGRLVSLDDVLVTPGRWRTTMKIEDSGRSIIAFMDASKRGALADLSPDHLLKVRAIVTGTPHFPEIRLWIPAADDVQSLGMASDVITRRVWMWIGITAAVMATLVAWALLLRRSRTAIREMNAGLEKRVAERTAELAAAKDELSRALSQERDLNELKTRFISLVSHEFRTPLGITMSAVELLRHHRERLSSEKLTELLEDIHSSTLRMSGLMEQVLILGRVEAGKTAFKPAPVHLVELCDKLADEGLSATHRRCPVNFTATDRFDGAQADEALLRHIISNLLSNAVKYSPEGMPVEFRLRRENGHAVFTVQDRGIGIPGADQARLFEAFHRASNVGEIAGTGLGLLLVKRCVELHHGSITVDSMEGKGTTFTVRVPVDGEQAGSPS